MPRTTRPPEAVRRAVLASHAARQHGIFTRAQAVAAGYTSSVIGYRVRSGTWEIVDYGVYRFAGTPSSWSQRLLAACLAGPAVASHRSAAFLWHLFGVDDPPVEVTALRHRRRHRGDVIWHESRWLHESEMTIVSGIPVTTVTRTLVDLAVLGDESLLVLALDDALRRGLTSIPALLAKLERFGPLRPGARLLRKVLDRRIGQAIPESGPESIFDELLRLADLPSAVRQYDVFRRDGSFIGRADFAFPDARVLVEVQSVRHHGDVQKQIIDDRRHAAYASVGFRVLPIWRGDLRTRPTEVIATLRQALHP